MNMKRIIIASSATLLALLAPAAVAVDADPVATAESAAKAGAAEAPGLAFADSLSQAFGREHSATIQQCAKETKRPELADFALLVRVDGTGAVDQVLVKPVTNLATCVQGKLVGWRGSAPPRAGFWVKISVNLKRK